MLKLKHWSIMTCVALGLMTGQVMAEDKHGSDEQRIYGWVEKAVIEPSWGAEVKAKLDTGALTSSMQAANIERFKKDGADWVRFEVEVKDESSGETVSRTFEREIMRKLVLSGAGGRDRRPAVLMTVCVGGEYYEEQFSLRDRSGMIYPVLLGRRTIQELGPVDVTHTFRQDGHCDEDSPVHRYADKELDGNIGA